MKKPAPLKNQAVSSRRVETSAPDVTYSWFVSASSFLVHFVVLGCVYSFGVFFEPIKLELDIGNSTAAWIVSVNQFFLLLVGPVAGRLVERFGFQKPIVSASLLYCLGMLGASFSGNVVLLCLTFGVVMGCAGGTVFQCSLQCVVQWFEEKRGLGVGLAVAGSGIGNFVLPQIGTALIKSLGWRAALRWFAVGAAVILACAALVTKNRVIVTHTKQSSAMRSKIAKRQIRTWAFFWMLCQGLFVALGYFIPFLLIREFAISSGHSEAFAVTYALGGIGVASTVGRVLFGFVADKYGRIETMLFSFFMMMLACFVLPFWTTKAAFVLFSIFYGANAGAFIALSAPLCAEFFPSIVLPSLTGLVYSSSAVGNLFGSPIAGALVDRSKEFTVAFLFAAASILVAFVSLLVLHLQKPVRWGVIEREELILVSKGVMLELGADGAIDAQFDSIDDEL